MKAQLLVSVGVYREKFQLESFIGSNDIFMLCGDGSFVVTDNGKDYTVSANEGFLFRKNTLYHRVIKSPAHLFLFRFESKTPIFRTSHITFSDTARILSTMAMLDSLDKVNTVDDFSLRRHLFDDIVNQYLFENRSIPSDSISDPLMEKAASDIRESINKRTPLSEIGAKTGLSYVQFIRRFKECYGLTPQDYQKGLRIRRAKDMLSETNMLIREIAIYCGFENEYYFSNYFKKSVGMSPSEFRSTTE